MHRELVLSVLFLSQIGNLVFCGEHYISLHNFWIEMGFALVLLLSRLVWACWCVTRIIRPYIFGGRAVFPTSTKALNKSKYALWCLISSVYLCFSSLSYACVHLRVTILLSPELRGLQMWALINFSQMEHSNLDVVIHDAWEIHWLWSSCLLDYWVKYRKYGNIVWCSLVLFHYTPTAV